MTSAMVEHPIAGINASLAMVTEGGPAIALLVVVRGDRVIVLQKPKVHHAAIRGIAEGVYPVDYLAKERKSWD